MKLYKRTIEDDSIIRTSDNAKIPFHDGNRDYEEFKLWIADGNQPDEADPLPEVITPASVESGK